MATKQVSTKEGLSSEFKFLLAGTPINIDIVTPAGQKGRFRTVFIGYLPEQYILIQFPDAGKLGNYAQYIVKDVQITVRGLVEGHEASVIAFQSSIMQTLNTPSKIMVLKFPDRMVIHNLRATKRVQTELATKVTILSNDNEDFSAVMTDISLTGCHIATSEGGFGDLEEDMIISLAVDTTDEAPLEVNAKVCNLKSLDAGVEFGCQFEAEQDIAIQKMLHMALLSENS